VFTCVVSTTNWKHLTEIFWTTRTGQKRLIFETGDAN